MPGYAGNQLGKKGGYPGNYLQTFVLILFYMLWICTTLLGYFKHPCYENTCILPAISSHSLHKCSAGKPGLCLLQALI